MFVSFPQPPPPPPLPNSYVEILTLKMMALGAGAFGGLGYKGGALKNGINALIRDLRGLPPCVGAMRSL